MTKPKLSELFHHRSFILFWLARLAGMLAQQMLMVAVAWQMYDITGSAWDLGLVGLFQFVPALLLTLPAAFAAAGPALDGFSLDQGGVNLASRSGGKAELSATMTRGADGYQVDSKLTGVELAVDSLTTSHPSAVVPGKMDKVWFVFFHAFARDCPLALLKV